MAAFTDLHHVTLHGTVTRHDGQPATGTVLVAVNSLTQDQAAGALIVEQPDERPLVAGAFEATVPARATAPAPLVEITVRLADNQRPTPYQFEVVTSATNVTWGATV